MKNKFLKASYNLMAALVLTILVAGPYATPTQASGELLKAPDTELQQLNGCAQYDYCMF